MSTSPSSPPVIAIDGPAASGKGTVAERVARRIGFAYLDSGALYRLVALAAERAGVSPDAESQVAALAAVLPVEFRDGQVFLAGDVVTDAIRTEGMSSAASRVAALPSVRDALLARQRAFRTDPGLVAEGRDMGTVVFPDAALKVFLTAAPEVRAERRYKQLMAKGLSANIDVLLREIRERDARDSTRSAAPLKPAADAVTIDTSAQGVEDVVEHVLALWMGIASGVTGRPAA
jgi:cytidylate kinase